MTVYSDSQLCVKTINEWAEAWEERGWRRKTGPIANLELVQELYAPGRRTPERVARVDPRARRLALERVRRRAGQLVPARTLGALDRDDGSAHGRSRVARQPVDDLGDRAPAASTARSRRSAWRLDSPACRSWRARSCSRAHRARPLPSAGSPRATAPRASPSRTQRAPRAARAPRARRCSRSSRACARASRAAPRARATPPFEDSSGTCGPRDRGRVSCTSCPPPNPPTPFTSASTLGSASAARRAPASSATSHSTGTMRPRRIASASSASRRSQLALHDPGHDRAIARGDETRDHRAAEGTRSTADQHRASRVELWHRNRVPDGRRVVTM